MMNHALMCPACTARRPEHTSEEIRMFHPSRNENCPACLSSRIHNADEQAQFHQLAGHGRTDVQRCFCAVAECPYRG